MLPPRRSPDLAADHARVDDLVTTLRREAVGAEADPFDDAMVAAVAGLAEVIKLQAGAMRDLQERARRLARRAAS